MNWKKYWWLWLLIGVVVLYPVFLGVGRALRTELLVVKISGTIVDSKDIVDWIEYGKNNPQIRGMLLVINSPGGAIVPSDEIYQSIVSFKKSGKPVVAYLGSVAASGGYYIACAADYIVSHPLSLTGSIGVILEYPVVEKLMQKLGVEMVVVKSGEIKDIASPFRKLSPKERKILENVVNQGYMNFVKVVSESRHLSVDSVLKIADGRVITGADAYRWGLVDTLGTLDVAKERLKELTKVIGPVRFVEKKRLPAFLRFLDFEGHLEDKVIPKFDYRMVMQ